MRVVSASLIAAFYLTVVTPDCFLAHGGLGADDDGSGGKVDNGNKGGENGEDGEGSEGGEGGENDEGREGSSVDDSKYPGPCTEAVVNIYRGSMTYTDTITYTYDENGNLLFEEGDTYSDGIVNYRVTYTYDDNGNRVTEEYDDKYIDGTVNSRYTYTYDERGNLLTEESDVNADGTIDMRVALVPESYNDDGNILTAEWYTSIGDQVVSHQRRTYTYDESGNLLTEDHDHTADGTVDVRWTRTYDANGNKLTEEYDDGADGTVDERTTYTYDSDGNLLTEDYDNGAISPDRTYTYDCWE